ncbi:PAS domain S-box protein [Aquabacterium soli]|jgi:PAS domain S-box-containing protein|uniref:histidine kinase n=1 Tax=Aquabacterium soli TaxID=2493092 RepID=A0A426VGF4_9BURK|nr:PAS domain S-box protein [Aquabacterium soli]RRS05821.1 PAS domain S-box protein [Aquabacterium soli]
MNRELWIQLVQQSPDALVVTRTPREEIMLWNQRAEAVLGYSSEEATGASLPDLIQPFGKERAAAIAEGGEESVRRCKSGILIYVNAATRPLLGDDGEPWGTLHRFTDITSQRVRRTARHVESRYRDVLESMPDAIVIVNDAGHIILVNRQLERLFHYAGLELLGQPIEVLVPERYHHRHTQHRGNYLSAPRLRPMGAGLELFGRRKDGSEFPVEISLSPLETDDSTLVSAAIRDITERKRFEQALREKNDELLRANQAKNRFLATMSHELRTPLNAIIGFTGLMLMKLPGPLTQDQEKQLTAVQSSGKHLLSLINDLLDLARIESERVEMSIEPVVWQDVVHEVVTALRPAAQAKGLALLTDMPEAPVVAPTNRRALHQIIINLANNAVKYTRQGQVRIEVTQHQTDGHTHTEVAVADTGVGISPQDQERLFQAFMQVGSASSEIEGTGLGLYLCSKLAELLEGRIELQSTQGVGSRFSFCIDTEDRP